MLFTASDFPGTGGQLSIDEIVELCALAERVGLDRFAITDFPFQFDTVSLMTACLRGTSRIEVESLVTTPYLRLADVAACAWATMADLSGGRAILGIGGGGEATAKVWAPPWGNTRPRPVRAVREFTAVCRQMWAGGVPRVDGEVIRSSGLPLGFAVERGVRVLIAARGPMMLSLAGELADIVHIASPYLGVEYQRSNLRLIADGAAKSGRRTDDIEIDLTVSLCVSSDGEEARRLAKLTTGKAILWMAGADEFAKNRSRWERPAGFAVPDDVIQALAEGWDMWGGAPLPPELADLITDPILDQFTIAGTPQECAAGLRKLRAELPEVTGVRLKLPAPIGAGANERLRDVITAAGEMVGVFRAGEDEEQMTGSTPRRER